MTALHAEAVAPEVVVTARRAHQPSRRIRLKPPLVLSPVPDAILRAEHPAPAFVVQHGEVSDRDPEGARLQTSGSALLDQVLVTNLGVGERIYRHAREYGGVDW